MACAISRRSSLPTSALNHFISQFSGNWESTLIASSNRSRCFHQHACKWRSTATVLDIDKPKPKPLNKVPGPFPHWGLGTVPYYWLSAGAFSIPNYLKTLEYMHEKYGRIVREKRGDETIVHVFEPDDIKAVYQKEGKYPAIAPLARTTQEFRKNIKTSPGLGNINGADWHRLRRRVHILSKPKEVEHFLDACDKTLDKFMLRIKKKLSEGDGEVTNFIKDLERWTLESAGLVNFERNLGLLEDTPTEKYQKFIDLLVLHLKLTADIQFSSVRFHKYFNTSKWKKIVDVEIYKYQIIKELVDDAIQDLRAVCDKGEIDDSKYRFLRHLLSDENQTYREALSEIKDRKTSQYEDILILGLSLFGDGVVTTAPMACGLLYYIATNPEKQEKCYEEIEQKLQGDTCIKHGILGQMSYVKACVKESLRLFPVGPEIIRIPSEDVHVDNFHIPAGTMVHVNSYALLKSEKYFQDADKFVPERWLRGSNSEEIHPFMHLPFSHGPRQCAGRRIAEQELYCLLIKMLQNFKMEWSGSGELGQIYMTLQTPDLPINLKLTTRR